MSQQDKSPPMEASKWLQTQVLLDEHEMEDLLSSLGGPIHILQTGRVLKKGEEKITTQQFLHRYSEYIATLKQGKDPEDAVYRSYFSSIWTLSETVVVSISVDSERHVMRLVKPAIQLQLHRLGYSKSEGKFRPMIFGKDSIDWGIQFSYPQLYKDPFTHEAQKVIVSDAFPNTALFQQLQRWLRQHSQPTPFLVGTVKTNVPIRLGKRCFAWINIHPQLSLHDMRVENVGH